ncbi:MAG: peptidase M16 family protein [Vulcanimicrobiaceae bacterium]
MRLRTRLASVALLGSVIALTLPALATDAVQQQGTMPRGGSYILYRDPTIASAAIDLWFRAPDAGYDNASPGIARVAAIAAAAAPLESGKSLAEIVRTSGGTLSVNVYPDIVGVSALVPATAARRVIASMTAAYFAPTIDDTSVKTAVRDTAVLSVQQHYSAVQSLHNALFAEIFSRGPAHVAPIPGTLADISRIDTSDVTVFAKRAFRSTNATLTIVGNVAPSSVDAVTAGTPRAAASAPIDSPVASPLPAPTSVPGGVEGIGLAWVGPPIRDEKAATAMDFVSDYLFRYRTGIVAKQIDASGDTYVTGQFITLHDPGVMLITVGGANVQVAKAQVIDALAKLERPLDAATFTAAQNAFLYHLAADTQTPTGLSDNLGWYAAEGNATYAPGDISGAYVQQARSLDPNYVASVVKQFLAHPVIVQLVPNAKESSS